MPMGLNIQGFTAPISVLAVFKYSKAPVEMNRKPASTAARPLTLRLILRSNVIKTEYHD